MGDLSVWQILNGHGYAMWGLVLCSLVVLTIVIERSAILWGFLPRVIDASSRATELLARDAFDESRSACERAESPVGDVFLAGFARVKDAKNPDHIASAVERERLRLVGALRRRIWLVGTIGALAPFVGLYGTVLGIMGAFSTFENQEGDGGIESVSGDIAQALIVTAAGIIVALLAVVLYNYMNQRVARISTELKLRSQEFVEYLSEYHKDKGTAKSGD